LKRYIVRHIDTYQCVATADLIRPVRKRDYSEGVRRAPRKRGRQSYNGKNTSQPGNERMEQAAV
jgi:hypothetical protein